MTKQKLSVEIYRDPDTRDLPLPVYKTSGSAGMDLSAAVSQPVTIEPGKRAKVRTGIHIGLPEGYEAQVRPRSGLADKYGIGLVNSPGTIDSDYRGEICVILMNWGDEPFVIQRGDRIAQMVFAQVTQASWLEVDELTETERGQGGFGHTGR